MYITIEEQSRSRVLRTLIACEGQCGESEDFCCGCLNALEDTDDPTHLKFYCNESGRYFADAYWR